MDLRVTEPYGMLIVKLSPNHYSRTTRKPYCPFFQSSMLQTLFNWLHSVSALFPTGYRLPIPSPFARAIPIFLLSHVRLTIYRTFCSAPFLHYSRLLELQVTVHTGSRLSLVRMLSILWSSSRESPYLVVGFIKYAILFLRSIYLSHPVVMFPYCFFSFLLSFKLSFLYLFWCVFYLSLSLIWTSWIVGHGFSIFFALGCAHPLMQISMRTWCIFVAAETSDTGSSLAKHCRPSLSAPTRKSLFNLPVS